MKPWMRYALIVIEVVFFLGLLFLLDEFGLLSTQKITQVIVSGVMCITIVVAHRTLGYFWMHSIILGAWLFVISLWYMIMFNSDSSWVHFLFYVMGVVAATGLKDYTYDFLHLTLQRRK